MVCAVESLFCKAYECQFDHVLCRLSAKVTTFRVSNGATAEGSLVLLEGGDEAATQSTLMRPLTECADTKPLDAGLLAVSFLHRYVVLPLTLHQGFSCVRLLSSRLQIKRVNSA